MRYWTTFGVALAAVVGIASLAGWRLGVPLTVSAVGGAAIYGLLVAANVAPPGRPKEAPPPEDDELLPFDYRVTLPYPVPPFPRMPASAAIPASEAAEFDYDPLDEAYAYYYGESRSEGRRNVAGAFLFAGMTVLALGALGLGAVVARAGRDSGNAGAPPANTPAGVVSASTVAPTRTPVATPTQPEPTPTVAAVAPTPAPSPTPVATPRRFRPTATPTEVRPTATPTQAPPTKTPRPASTPSPTRPVPTATKTPPPTRGGSVTPGGQASPPGQGERTGPPRGRH